MARVEKTVFISYRRTDVYTALAVYENLKNQGYDVFFDYTSISSGDFEQTITGNIKARAHFLLILTPTALDRCSEPGDWLRREIEIAIDEKRNIVPLFFKGFGFGTPSVSEKLTGKLRNLSRYNGLNVHEDYFQGAMQRLCTQFLNIPLDTVLHPVSTDMLKAAIGEQVAADKALGQRENIKELERLESQAIQYELKGDFWSALKNYYKIKKIEPSFPRVDTRIKELERELQPKQPGTKTRRSFPSTVAVGAGFLLLSILSIWGGWKILSALPVGTPEPAQPTGEMPTQVPQPSPTPSVVLTVEVEPSPIPPMPTADLSWGVKDGMELVSIPAGKFQMGSDGNESDERPVRTVYLDAFLIDKTEVTNAMYALCVKSGRCDAPRSNTSISQNAQNDSFYYGNPDFDDFPVIFVSWIDAKAYCNWAGRRLPTEAEWEKAASWDDQQQVKRLYPWGNTIDCSYANYYGDGKTLCVGDTTPVGSYPAGASFYGILDMAGNVWEWVADRYDPEYYGKSDDNNPTGPSSGDYIVIRGGSFLTGRAVGIRSSDREKLPPANTSQHVGFRCAADAP